MREFPEGTQILTSPPPSHALYGKYFGRLAILPDFSEELLDPSLLVEEPSAEGGSEDSDAD